MGDFIQLAALRRARDEALAATEREERLFAFATVRVGLERTGNLTADALLELGQCLAEAGLTEADLLGYLDTHRAEVAAFLDSAGA